MTENSMEFSNIIAIIALVVSTLSAWFSYKAHRDSMLLKQLEARHEFTREKSEFLVRIEKISKLFEKLEGRLTALISHIESAPESVQTHLTKEIEQLKSDSNYLDGCQRQARSLWQETYEMSESGFSYHKPRYLDLIESDEVFALAALQNTNLIEGELERAKRFTHNELV